MRPIMQQVRRITDAGRTIYGCIFSSSAPATSLRHTSTFAGVSTLQSLELKLDGRPVLQTQTQARQQRDEMTCIFMYLVASVRFGTGHIRKLEH